MKTFKNEKPEKQINPIAQFMADDVIGQIMEFLNADTDAKRVEISNHLFENIKFPSHLDVSAAPEGADKCEVWLMQKTTGWTPESRHRMSLDAVVMNSETGRPMFFLTAFISAGENPFGNVVCYEHGDHGAIYRNTLRWNSKRQGD